MDKINSGKKLRLNGNKGIDVMTQALVLAHAQVSPIKLYLNQINDEIISAIANLLLDAQFNFETLTIRNSYMRLSGAQSIINFISGSTLKKIKISKGVTEPYADVFTAIIGSIERSSVHKLSVCGLRIDACKANNIVGAVHQSCLTKLALVGCIFCEDALILIMNAVKYSAISTLNLKKLHIGEAEFIALSDCIANSNLTKLSLHGTYFGRDMTSYNKKWASATPKRLILFDAIQQSSLQILDTRSTDIFCSMRDVKNIIGNISITKFKFNQSIFKKHKMISLIDSAYERISLKNMYCNNETLIKVHDAIKGTNLTHLSLSYCRLTLAQLEAIILLTKGSSIVSLNLNGNYLNSNCILAICDLLENHWLQKINISNMLNDTLLAILPSIRVSSLIKCKLSASTNNNIRSEIREIIAATRRKNIFNGHYKIKSARS